MRNMRGGRKSKLEEKQDTADGREIRGNFQDKCILIMLPFSMRCPAVASPVADSQDINRRAHQSQAGSPSNHLISSPLDSFTSFFLFFLMNISILKEHIVLFLKILSWWLRW